ncbi:DUF4105 domain-containing protein [Flagellimonas meishanensis]|uniref:lipoprotein N-acyltransferase Lnb domain-containing protein n=1 Tax=Flagellimonas meishanensis TaxID=2873264 RepID=UPI001CA673A4|nr:DUF4105 domain-containing protein [[Muricauda] meishanensis]
MKLRSVLFIGFLLLVTKVFAQVPQLTDRAQISLLTCAAGDELYYSFGHTALRVQDPVLGIDVVYNYGTFDFNRPNFYLNFVKGKLVYSLSRRSFDAFLYDYELERRWVKEQILDLDLEEKNGMLAYLENNYLPQNRDYLYDPLWHNCSSITGDILKDLYGDAIVFDGSHLEKRYTFRQLVRQHLDINSWGAFGIDVAFGSVVDRKATVREHMFLPYYTMSQMRNTTKNGKPLLQRERTVLDYAEHVSNSYFPLSPLFWFTLLLIFTATITYFDYKHKSRSRWLDFSLLLLTGHVGTILFLLWVATDHTSTPYNFNLLWAFPLNLVVGFVLIFQPKLPSWSITYFWFLLVLFAILILLWVLKIQVFSPVIIPIMLTLGIRYAFGIKMARP